MNKKLIAAAVSAVVVAPVAAQADVTVYGRINNAIDLNDISDAAGADSTTDLSSVSSRFGVKYSKEMGNGLSAHGRYEWSTTTDKESGRAFVRADNNDKSGTTGLDDIRIATVGVSGPFGRIDAGNQWSAYFNTFGTLISPTYTLGYYLYSSVGGGAFRASNTIKYSNTFGPVYAELDLRFNDDASPEGSDVAETLRGDGIGLGLIFSVTDNITVAVAYDSEDRDDDRVTDPSRPSATVAADGTANDGVLGSVTVIDDEFSHDEDRLGIAVKGNFGGYWAAVGWQNHELDDTEDIPVTGSLDVNDDGDVADVVGGIDEDDVSLTIDVQDDTDTFFLYGGGKFGENTSWMLGYAEADDGITVINDSTGATVETDDSSQFIWAVYHNLGGGLKLYYEAVNLDSENKSWDGSRHLLGMRVDF